MNWTVRVHHSTPYLSLIIISVAILAQAILAQGPRWTSYLHRGLEPRWNLIRSNQLSVGALLCKTFSFLHVAIVVLYRLWKQELVKSPYVSSVRADSERIQWEFVGACRQERQDKWKGERGAHKATSQATVSRRGTAQTPFSMARN